MVVCVATTWTGGILATNFVFTLALYVRQYEMLSRAYKQALAETKPAAVHIFWGSETVMTLLWICSAIATIVMPSSDNCDYRNTLFAGAIVHGIGSLSWPIVVDDYTQTNALAWPGKEEIAMLLTAIGAGVMAFAMSRLAEEQGSPHVAVFAMSGFAYMAFHYTIIDTIGWSLVRRALHKKRSAAMRASAAMQTEMNTYSVLDVATK